MFTGFDAIGMAAIGETPETRFVFGGSADWRLDWEVLIYAASHEYITRSTDTPADQAFLGTLEKAFRIDRSIIGDRIGEQITIGLGEVRLNNYEGRYDFLADDHTPLGQRIVIKMGDRRRPYAEWRVVLDGFMTNHQPDRDGVVFTLRDGGHKLDVPASPNVYLGTGGTEGTTDLEGKRKPRWYGWNLNVSPPLVIPSALAYQLNDGQIHAVQNVYIRGVAQVFTANYATVILMNAAALTVGQYATCLAAGWMRIGVAADTELGQVTCDFAGDKTGGVFVEKTADIVRRILEISTTYIVPDELSVATFDALNVAQPAPVGDGVPVGDEKTAAALIGSFMANIGGWGGARRSGRYEVRRFEAPVSPPIARYTKETIVDIVPQTMPGDLSPPPWRVLTGYARNNTIQTDLAGSVTEERRAFLKEEFRFGGEEDAGIKADFPPGHEITTTAGLFRDKVDADANAARYLDLYGGGCSLAVVKLAEMLPIHELGQVIEVTFDRFNLDDGKLMRIVKLSEDDAEGVEITGLYV